MGFPHIFVLLLFCDTTNQSIQWASSNDILRRIGLSNFRAIAGHLETESGFYYVLLPTYFYSHTVQGVHG